MPATHTFQKPTAAAQRGYRSHSRGADPRATGKVFSFSKRCPGCWGNPAPTQDRTAPWPVLGGGSGATLEKPSAWAAKYFPRSGPQCKQAHVPRTAWGKGWDIQELAVPVTIFCLCILMGILWFSHCLGTNRTLVRRTPRRGRHSCELLAVQQQAWLVPADPSGVCRNCQVSPVCQQHPQWRTPVLGRTQGMGLKSQESSRTMYRS